MLKPKQKEAHEPRHSSLPVPENSYAACLVSEPLPQLWQILYVAPKPISISCGQPTSPRPAFLPFLTSHQSLQFITRNLSHSKRSPAHPAHLLHSRTDALTGPCPPLSLNSHITAGHSHNFIFELLFLYP